MLVCLCKAVSDKDIRRAIDDGASTVKEVAQCTGAGTCCGTCHAAIREEIAERTQCRRLPLLAAAALSS